MKPTGSALFINVAAFQVGWFACVWGAAHGLAWAGTATVIAVVLWHLLQAHRPGEEAALLLVVGLIGAVWDSASSSLGWTSFPSQTTAAGTAPYWMIALWPLFATTFNVSLRWLKPHLRLAALLGAVGGPISYYAGARLGALEFADLARGLLTEAVGWAVLMPLLLVLARRLDGMAQRPTVAHTA
jgi:hypothetical protein